MHLLMQINGDPNPNHPNLNPNKIRHPPPPSPKPLTKQSTAKEKEVLTTEQKGDKTRHSQTSLLGTAITDKDPI
jgi:hypothetical protein